jgi:pimeloyl-ACP methyl ester carboxylesterase
MQDARRRGGTALLCAGLLFMAALCAPSWCWPGTGATAAQPWQGLPPTPRLPEATASGIAAVNGVRLYFARFGTGYPLLLLHGGLANADYWGSVIPRLVAGHFAVIVLDSRGHGRSTRTDQPYSYALLASDVLAFLDYLKLPQVDLVGWSDGGIIGLDLAMQHPDRLHRLAVYGANSDPSGVRDGIDTNPVFGAYIARTRREYSMLSPTPRDYARFLAQIEAMWAAEPRYTRADLQSIHTPTLVFDGAHDEAIKREHTEYLAQTIPGARLVILDGVSHFGMIQDPARFAATVIDFLTAE